MMTFMGFRDHCNQCLHQCRIMSEQAAGIETTGLMVGGVVSAAADE